MHPDEVSSLIPAFTRKCSNHKGGNTLYSHCHPCMHTHLISERE